MATNTFSMGKGKSHIILPGNLVPDGSPLGLPDQGNEWGDCSILDNVPIGIYRTTPDGRILFANKAFLGMLGLKSIKEFDNHNLTDENFEPGYPRKRFMETMEKYGEIKGLESVWLRRDGTSVFVRENARAVHDKSGKICYYEGSIEDLTEKKTAEQLIRDSEEKYRIVTENISDVIWMYNIKGAVFTYFSPSVKRIFGFTQEEALSMKLEDIVSPDSAITLRDNITGWLKRAIAHRETDSHYSYETEQLCKDGQTLWVETNLTFRRNRIGEIELLGISRSIMRRKKAEVEILRERILLRTIIDNIPDAIYVKDTMGRKLLANRCDLKNMGYFSEKEVIGKTDLEIFEDEGARKGYEEDMEVIKSEFPLINHEGFFYNRAGKACWMLTTKVPLYDETGNITGLVGIGHDLTYRKESELKLSKLAGELKEINDTKDKLFSIIAHDMRGPIGSFYQILEMLTNKKGLDEALKNTLLEELKKASKNIFNLLENLLNWSRIQRSLISIDPESFLIEEAVAENIELLRPNAKQKNITLKMNIEEQTKVFADRDSINLVLRNLLSNAIKFTPNNGSVTIETIKNQSNTILKIIDTGVGINPEILDKLFYSGSHFTTFGTNGEKGAGIGLVLCRDFIEKNGGTIRAESTLGVGSTIILTLPQNQRKI